MSDVVEAKAKEETLGEAASRQLKVDQESTPEDLALACRALLVIVSEVEESIEAEDAYEIAKFDYEADVAVLPDALIYLLREEKLVQTDAGELQVGPKFEQSELSVSEISVA